MAFTTCFDNLPDLILIELFSYLSSSAILWGFTDLNHRLTTLIIERGYFYHINLSLARYNQFNTIVGSLPLNDIQSLAIDNDASPLQLTRWPYLPRLKTLRIIGVYNHDDLLLFLLLHAATLTHLIVKSNERLVPDGFSIKWDYPLGCFVQLINNIILIHLPALRSLDLGINYYGTSWPFTTRVVPLTYLRLGIPSIDALVRLMSTPPLFQTLRQLHVKVGNSSSNICSFLSASDLSMEMVNLHTFTLLQKIFSMLTIEWTIFEKLTSSKVMPALRRANVSVFLNVKDLNEISSGGLFNDHRHVDVHFAFHLINCSQYREVTQYIPHGSHFYPRDVVGATLIVNHWTDRSQWSTNGDVFIRGHEYAHHMWYTLPWRFDELFHEYLPIRWITRVHVFQMPSSKTKITGQSSLRTLDAVGQTSASSLSFLPHIALSDRIETLHLSYCNAPISREWSALRHLILANSVDCLSSCSSLPATLRSVRILIFCSYPNYQLPNWPVVLDSLSNLSELHSLRIFMYDLLKTVDNGNDQVIAKAVSNFADFGFSFRYKLGLPGEDAIFPVFDDHRKFIKQLCHYTLLSSLNNQPHYFIEDDGCGVTMWF